MQTKSIFVFIKAQASAFLGGLTDYVLMIVFTELFHIHYTSSILMSGILGAVINFSLNKVWAFKSNEPFKSSAKLQLFKFSFVVIGSIFLKSSGTYLIVSLLNVNYRISRLMVDSIVSYGFNYPLIKLWVFKKISEGKRFNNEQYLFI